MQKTAVAVAYVKAGSGLLKLNGELPQQQHPITRQSQVSAWMAVFYPIVHHRGERIDLKGGCLYLQPTALLSMQRLYVSCVEIWVQDLCGACRLSSGAGAARHSAVEGDGAGAAAGQAPL